MESERTKTLEEKIGMLLFQIKAIKTSITELKRQKNMLIRLQQLYRE